MSRRRYYHAPWWEHSLLVFAFIGGVAALVFLLIAIVTGVKP